jgi:hypothetical protein
LEKMDKNGGSAWDVGGMLRIEWNYRMKLISTVILGYKMKNQLSIDSMPVGTALWEPAKSKKTPNDI